MAAPCMTLKPAGLRTPFLASRPARATPRCLTAARASSSSSEAHVQVSVRAVLGSSREDPPAMPGHQHILCMCALLGNGAHLL